MEIRTQDEIMDASEYPEGNRKIVVFDVLVNAPDKTQSKIANYFTDGRHHNISLIYLGQSYYDVPKKLSLNCSHMILYPPVTKKHCNLIGKENMIDPKLFERSGPYESLFLNKENKSNEKNLDETM